MQLDDDNLIETGGGGDAPIVEPQTPVAPATPEPQNPFTTEAYKQKRAGELFNNAGKEAFPKQNNQPDNALQPPAIKDPQQQEAQGFDKLLLEASNGKFKTRADISSFLQQAEQQQLQLQQLQGQEKLSPFENEFTQKFNDLVKGGADHKQISRFVQFNSPDLDISTMPDADALKEFYRNKYSGITDADFESHMEETYGSDLEGLPLSKKIQLQKDVEQARTWLQDQRVNVSEPESVRQQRQQKLEHDQRLQTWTPHIKQMVDNFDMAIPMSKRLLNLSAEGDVGSESIMNFKFDLPEQFRPDLEQAVMQLAANTPPTQQNLASLQQQAKRIVWGMHGEQIAQLMCEDIFAKTSKDYTQYYAGTQVNRATPVDQEVTKHSKAQKDKQSYKQRRAQELLNRG